MTNALISIAFFILSTNARVSLAPTQKELVKPRLSVMIQSAKSSYRITENIDFEIRLENVGQESLLVCRWLGWGPAHTELRIIDSNGKDVCTAVLADDAGGPTPRDNDFVKLQPGKSFTSALSGIATDFVNTPGSCTVFLEYRSPVSEDWAQQYLHLAKLPLWSSERGTVASNKIRIEVIK